MSRDDRPFSFRMTTGEAEALVAGAASRGESVSAFIRAAIEERLHPAQPQPKVAAVIGSPSATLQVYLPPGCGPTTWTTGAPAIIEWGPVVS